MEDTVRRHLSGMVLSLILNAAKAASNAATSFTKSEVPCNIILDRRAVPRSSRLGSHTMEYDSR